MMRAMRKEVRYVERSTEVFESIDRVKCEEPPIIIAEDLGLHSLQGHAYQHMNMTIPRGKVTALCGENGSGKTALLLTLTGRMVSNEGSLTIDGFTLPKQRNKMRHMAGIAFFERVNEVQPSLTVQALIAAELELYGMKSNHAHTVEYLNDWDLLDNAKTKAEKLTAEEHVRFGIALGMVSNPSLLAVDDIESALTQHQGRKLMHYLCTLAADGLTVLVGCTEYEIARGADAMVLLSPDSVAQRDKVEDLIDKRCEHLLPGAPPIKEAPAIVGCYAGEGSDE
jgi:ABC-type multidrug transport system ATPase subunit